MSIETFIEKAKQGTDTELHADRLKALGFGKSANVKLDTFYKAFNTQTELHAYYAAQYPQCQFITMEALHELCKAMDLWVDLPAHYTGDVPAEQLPWLEVFELEKNDGGSAKDLLAFTRITKGFSEQKKFNVERALTALFDIPQLIERFIDPVTNPYGDRYYHNVTPLEAYFRGNENMRSMMQEFRDSMFVVAPKVSFAVEKPWIERFNKLAEDAVEADNKAVSDPLVIHFCREGALIIAAWDKEGEAILEAANRL